MAQKLVDIFDLKGRLLFTYTVNLTGLNYEPSEDEFRKHGLECAKDDRLVPAEDIKTLTAKVR